MIFNRSGSLFSRHRLLASLVGSVNFESLTSRMDTMIDMFKTLRPTSNMQTWTKQHFNKPPTGRFQFERSVQKAVFFEEQFLVYRHALTQQHS